MQNDWIGGLQQGSVNRRQTQEANPRLLPEFMSSYVGLKWFIGHTLSDTHIRFSVFSPHVAAKYKFNLEKKS